MVSASRVIVAAAAIASAGAARLRAGTPPLGNDPADSWLAYTVARGNGTQITFVNASWVVPTYPATRQGGNAPGWWFGIEPNPADILIQPILAYGDGSPDYTIFDGYYNWHNSDWQMSNPITVKPGQTIIGTVALQEDGAYLQTIEVAGSGKKSSFPVPTNMMNGETFTDLYFVTEHQPAASCSEYPASGGIIFKDITVAWGGKFIAPTWEAQTFKPACNIQAKVLSPSSVQFLWSTSD